MIACRAHLTFQTLWLVESAFGICCYLGSSLLCIDFHLFCNCASISGFFISKLSVFFSDLGSGGRERRQCRCNNIVNVIAVSSCSFAFFHRIAFACFTTITILKGSITVFGDLRSALFHCVKAPLPCFFVIMSTLRAVCLSLD